jgi:hypothetical protein
VLELAIGWPRFSSNALKTRIVAQRIEVGVARIHIQVRTARVCMLQHINRAASFSHGGESTREKNRFLNCH